MNVEQLSLSSREVSKRVKRGDYILKKKKNAKGSRAWEQFRIVWDVENGEEVFGSACCTTCKTCLLYKKLVNGAERSMGTKNLLDHLKHCVRDVPTVVGSGRHRPVLKTNRPLLEAHRPVLLYISR